jgi:hypothetical protein
VNITGVDVAVRGSSAESSRPFSSC